MLAIVSQPGIHCPTCNMPWSLWIIALFQDEPANFEKSLAGFWALSVDSLVLHPKLFHPWHCRMDKPGIGSSEPSQFCHEKCVAWGFGSCRKSASICCMLSKSEYQHDTSWVLPTRWTAQDVLTRCSFYMTTKHLCWCTLQIALVSQLIHCDKNTPKILPVAGGSAFLSQVSQLQVL